MNNYEKIKRIKQLENQMVAINNEIDALKAEINEAYNQNFEGQIFKSHGRYMRVIKDNEGCCLCLFFYIQDNFYENDDDNKNFWLGENIPKDNEFTIKIDLKCVDKQTVIGWSKHPVKIEELSVDIKKLIHYINEHFTF